LRSQSKCTQNVIGGYIGGKMIQSPQFTQDVPTGFQVTSPPVCRCEQMEGADLSHSCYVAETSGLPTPVGFVGTVLAVLAFVDSQWSHATLPVPSSDDTCGYAHNV